MVSPNWVVVIYVMGFTHIGTALADFRMVTPAQPTVSDSPHFQPGDGSSSYLKRIPKASSAFTKINARHGAAVSSKSNGDIVEGFGAAVPLAFACRQILPKQIKVVYAQGVDTTIPVNWTGGRSWAAVLREAIQPAGLTLVPRGLMVEIRK